jgi:hypothetical protein
LSPFQNKEPSVPVRSDTRPVYRSTRSELDRRAINVVGHLLTTGLWMEHQVRNTSKSRIGFIRRTDWVRLPSRRLRSADVQFTEEQPSPIDDVLSR